jgi:hypothetical protein
MRNLFETGHCGTDSKDWFRTSAVPVVPMLLLQTSFVPKTRDGRRPQSPENTTLKSILLDVSESVI